MEGKPVSTYPSRISLDFAGIQSGQDKIFLYKHAQQDRPAHFAEVLHYSKLRMHIL